MMINELERIRKEATIVASVGVLSQNFPGETEKDHEKLHDSRFLCRYLNPGSPDCISANLDPLTFTVFLLREGK
jgi:hypothetical protein